VTISNTEVPVGGGEVEDPGQQEDRPISPPFNAGKKKANKVARGD